MSRNIAVIDCETDPFKRNRFPAPFIWGFFDGDNYLEFATGAELIDFLKDQHLIVYAHNGGKFDYFFLLSQMAEFSEIMVINGRIARFKIGNCEFRDSYNILPVPLSAYQKTEIDYNIFERSERAKPHNWNKIKLYLKDDCVFLHEFVTAFINTYGINLTLAGAAMKQWRKISGKKASNTSPAFYESISPYFYGGRVECFKSGIIDFPTKIIDINSAYPDAMNNLHPWGAEYDISRELPRAEGYLKRAFITLKAESRGALPYRVKEGKDAGKLIFPNDGQTREFHITGHEFLAARETNALVDFELLKVISFHDSIDFREYVAHFYELKSTAKKGTPEYIFAKLFLNSLYGKWGANPSKYREYQIVRPAYIEAAEVDGYEFYSLLGPWGVLSRPSPEDRQRWYNVATAASITGFVRAKLIRALAACDTPLYCDTDSIICKGTGPLELHPTKLGAWDLEAEPDHGGIAGKKLYAFHLQGGKWKTACKGAKLSADEILTVCKGESVKYLADAPTFSISAGIRFNHRKIEKTA